MKNLSIILNFVLVVAVAYLYVIHFKKTPDSVPHPEEPAAVITNKTFAPGSIVFVNSDSLLNQYAYYKNIKAAFESKQERLKSELRGEQEKLQNEAEAYQQRASGMTELDRQQTEEQLMMKQQKLVQKKDNLLEQLDNEQSKSSEELYTRLSNYLKEFNKSRNYNFVLGFQKGGGILFANDSLNITAQVIEGLNKAYAAEKK